MFVFYNNLTRVQLCNTYVENISCLIFVLFDKCEIFLRTKISQITVCVLYTRGITFSKTSSRNGPVSVQKKAGMKTCQKANPNMEQWQKTTNIYTSLPVTPLSCGRVPPALFLYFLQVHPYLK